MSTKTPPFAVGDRVRFKKDEESCNYACVHHIPIDDLVVKEITHNSEWLVRFTMGKACYARRLEHASGPW